MKKKIIALAVATAASSAATAVELYDQDGTTLNLGGRAEFRGDFGGNTDGTEIDGTMENKSRFRLNIGGETKITDNLTGFGFYEGEQSAHSSADNSRGDDSDFNERYMFAGMKGNWGAISFGRQDTAAVQISQMSDVTTYTGAQKEFIAAGNEQVNNTILYSGDFFKDALNVKASFVAGSEDDTDGFGLSAIYTLPMGLGFGAGYSIDGDATAEYGDNKVNGEAYIIGVNYTWNALYMGLTYTAGDTGYEDNEEFNGIEMAAVYSFNNGLTIKGAYQTTEIEPDHGSDFKQSDFFELTADYQFAKNFNAYISYMLNGLDEEDIFANRNGMSNYYHTGDADDSLRLGLKYSF